MATVTSEQVLSALDARMSRMFKWEIRDCLTAASDAFLDLTGIDVAAPVRGKYSNLESARSIIDFVGGFPSLAEWLAEEAGLVPGDERPGSFGLSKAGMTQDELGYCFCICIRPGLWAAKTLRGYCHAASVERFWNAPDRTSAAGAAGNSV